MSLTLKVTVAKIEEVEPWSGIKMVVSMRIDDRKKLLEELKDQNLLAEPFGEDNDDMVDSSDLDETISKLKVMHSLPDILQELYNWDADEFLEWVKMHVKEE